MGKIVRPRSKWTSMKYEIPNAFGTWYNSNTTNVILQGDEDIVSKNCRILDIGGCAKIKCYKIVHCTLSTYK